MNRLAAAGLLCLLLSFAASSNSAQISTQELAEVFRTESEAVPIRVLTLTATHGYRHTAAIEAAKRVLSALNETTEFSFDFTEDVDDLNPAKLAKYDLLFLANATLRVDAPTEDAVGHEASAAARQAAKVQNPVTAEHRAAIVDFLTHGGGIVGAHSALDAFYGWGEYRRLVGGGLFRAHPWTQRVRIRIEDPGNPAVAHLGGEWWIRDEIYVLDINPRRTSHVLLSLDIGSVGVDADASNNDYPISWLREHKGGRVFMTKLGHFADVWTNPLFVQHLLQGMRLTAGRIPGNFAPRKESRQSPAG